MHSYVLHKEGINDKMTKISNQISRPLHTWPVEPRSQTPNSSLEMKNKSSLKYINSVFLSDSEYFIEKKFGLLTKVWVSILGGPKLLSRGQTLGAKSAKKCCHVGTLEAFHLWSLATSVKVQRLTSRLSTNHIVGFLHLSNRPAKCEDPLILYKFN